MHRLIWVSAVSAGCWSASTTAPTTPVRPDGIACINDELAFQLPFEPGKAWLVIQGNDGSFSHGGRYRFSWDFEMPEDTVVAATADGIAVEVVDGFTEGGVDDSFANKANLVVLDHGNARYSVYQHLRNGGTLVKEGQRVRRGQPIGRSGNTGYSTEPHLHFAIVDHRNRTLPACFADVVRGVPLMGNRYARGPAVRARAQPPAATSTIPRDAFEQNGIELTSDLPGRRMLEPFTVTGRATREGKRVVAWFSDREGDKEACAFYGVIGRDKRFSIKIGPRELGQLSELLNFAVAIEQPDATYYSDYSVPMVVRRADRTKPCASWSGE